MKRKLKDVVSLLDETMASAALSAPVDELCKIMKHVSGVECESRYLPYFISKLKGKNPGWYSNAVALVAAGADPETIVYFGRCSLKDNEEKIKVGAKPKEQRKAFHVNIPHSLYKELTEPIICRLREFRDAERELKK